MFCSQLSSDNYYSVELNIFELGRFQTVFCTVIYRPPKYLINDFSDILSGIMPNYDRILIIGDFNIHICCSTKPLVKDFLSLIDSFNLIQSVMCSTHEHGRALDLVLLCGLPVSNLEISDFFFVLILCLFFLISLFLVILNQAMLYI